MAQARQYNLADLQKLIQIYDRKGNKLNWRDPADRYLKKHLKKSENVEKVKRDLINSQEFFHSKVAEPFSTENYVMFFGSEDTPFQEEAKEHVMEFLVWLFESNEEAILFMKDELGKNEEFIEKFYASLLKQHYVNKFRLIIDEFLKFFFVTCETASNIENKMYKEIDKWIDICAVEHRCNFEVAYSLISWLSKCKENEYEVIAEYVNSPKCIWFYQRMLDSIQYFESYEHMTSFLNNWVKPYGNLAKIKRDLESLNAEEDKKLAMMSLINILQSGRDVAVDDVARYAPFTIDDGLDDDDDYL